MTDPFSLLPLATAAGGGRVDDLEARSLIAAGFTLLQRSAPLVRALARRRAGILLPTSHRYLTALAASDGRGTVLLNPVASPMEIARQVGDAGIGAVFTARAHASAIPRSMAAVYLDDAPERAVIRIDGDERTVDLGSHFGLDLAGDPGTPGSDDEAVIVYTSALAGTPRGAILSHRNVLSNARATVQAAGYTADDVVLAPLPWSHLFGLTVTCIAPLIAGARVLTMDRFHPGRALDLMTSERVTAFVGVPAIFRAILAAIDGGRRPPEHLRLCICGGAPLGRDLQDQWANATGVELRQGYGLTEAGPVCLFNPVDQPNRRGSLGVPFPGVEVTLRRPLVYPGATAQVRQDEASEICVRGPGVFRGYVGDATDALRVEDGWLHTGDLGLADADGSYRFAGLAKPMFTRNAYNIYPREIEAAIAELDGVRSVHAWGEAAAETEPDLVVEVEGRVSVDDVRAWCATRLSAYKQPTRVRVTR